MGQETEPCNAKKPQLTKLAREEQEPEAHCTQTDKDQARPGVCPPPQCTTAGGGQGLMPLYTSSLPWQGREAGCMLWPLNHTQSTAPSLYWTRECWTQTWTHSPLRH
jgi:hypothetical protein